MCIYLLIDNFISSLYFLESPGERKYHFQLGHRSSDCTEEETLFRTLQLLCHYIELFNPLHADGKHNCVVINSVLIDKHCIYEGGAKTKEYCQISSMEHS